MSKQPDDVYLRRVESAGLGAEDALLRLAAAPSSKLRYLGPYKVATIAGLRIAVFDDLRAQKCDALVQEINSSDGDVDLLLTASWPTDVLTGTPPIEGALRPFSRAVAAQRRAKRNVANLVLRVRRAPGTLRSGSEQHARGAGSTHARVQEAQKGPQR